MMFKKPLVLFSRPLSTYKINRLETRFVIKKAAACHASPTTKRRTAATATNQPTNVFVEKPSERLSKPLSTWIICLISIHKTINQFVNLLSNLISTRKKHVDDRTKLGWRQPPLSFERRTPSCGCATANGTFKFRP
jgi:hypothetical protein